MKLTLRIVLPLALAVISARASGLARGGVGLLAEYDSNVFGDYWGGGSLNGTAYFDLGLDFDLGFWGLVCGFDYTGDFSTYLQYRDLSQSDHELGLLLWRDADKNGYLAGGGGVEYGVNGPGRNYYNNRFLFGQSEGKIYFSPELLARFSIKLGKQAYFNLPEYECLRFSGELSASAFFPSRTSLTLGGNARWYGYSPGAESLRVPVAIIHLEPGVRATQHLAAGLGLAVEYFGVINRVSTTGPEYQPDTLLTQVFDYSDYRGGSAGCRLTLKAGGAVAAAKARYQFRKFTSLEAFALPSTDTSSLALRQPSGSLRQDKEASFSLEAAFPLAPSVRARAGLEFLDHWSNDPLFDYYRTIASAGLEYDF